MIHVALRFRASVDCTPVGVNRREANPLSRRPSLEGGRVRVGAHRLRPDFVDRLNQALPHSLMVNSSNHQFGTKGARSANLTLSALRQAHRKGKSDRSRSQRGGFEGC